jgi:hypothetical protein
METEYSYYYVASGPRRKKRNLHKQISIRLRNVYDRKTDTFWYTHVVAEANNHRY